MKYAVIKTGGKQYKVSENDVLDVERLSSPAKNIDFKDILLVVDESIVKVGKPFVNGATVKAEILGNKRGEKIRVSKYKSKVRYRRVTGHRQNLTKIQIKEIANNHKKSDAK